MCSIFCIGSGLVIAALLGLTSDFVPTLFSDNEEAIRVTRMFLWIVPVSYGTYGMVMVMNASFNGLGNPMPAVWISLTRTFIIYVPLAFAAMQVFDIAGIFAAYALDNVLTGIGAYVWARTTVRRLCPDAVSPAA